MRPAFLHHLRAALCLIAFGLQALLGGHVIRCVDASGSIHLEWGGCAPDAPDGHCSTGCDDSAPDDDHPLPSTPCEDTPVSKDVAAAGRLTNHTTSIDAIAPTWAAPTFTLQQPGLVFTPPRVELRAAAPPPALASIRTIVLVV